MQRQVFTVPPSLMRAMHFDWDIEWRGQPASDRTSGNTQIVYNAFPRWVGSPQVLLRNEQIRTWRAFRASAQGRGMSHCLLKLA